MPIRWGERGADGSDLSRPAFGWPQARGNRQGGRTRLNVFGELGLFTDEGARGQREAARAEGSQG
jgi:hypothetical protein